LIMQGLQRVVLFSFCFNIKLLPYSFSFSQFTRTLKLMTDSTA
jgi:hypothetical protein